MKLTPLMKQYWDVKNAHADKVILFRMGDFYEMFHDDALIAAPIIGIALTKRNPKDETPMCGVPHHSAEGPVNKLLRAGRKVAICEQLEDPALAKGIVKRGVTRILTPGMVYDPTQLPPDVGNYICSLDSQNVAFADASTGEAFYYSVAVEKLWSVIDILKPSEFLITPDFAERNPDLVEKLRARSVISTKSPKTGDASAVQLLREYISEAQGGIEPKEFELRHFKDKFVLSTAAIKHLEIFENNSGDRKSSLLWAIDRTKTSMGGRQLRRWLSFPESEARVIEERLQRVQEWTTRGELKDLRAKLALIGDMERRLGRLFLSNSDARDLAALAQSLHESIQIFESHSGKKSSDRLRDLVARVRAQLREDLPVGYREGGMIQRGVKPELDELMDLTTDHAQVLQKFEQREREASGIGSLKVKYNAVFGYFIEVTHTHRDKTPSHYIRKQTLAQAERYTTDELISLEQKILSARSRRNELEAEIFQTLREELKSLNTEIFQVSQWIGEFDVILAFAWLALEQNYVRPKIDTNKKSEVLLLSSRHPVVEQTQGHFVANDIRLRRGESMLLTGPNMAGKSTLMRQVALSSLLMQIGCFVPAREASLPIFSKILTRIGASDNLAEGLSTFMVEMKETAELIGASDSDSLVILDEIGRGTATFDGMALAQAILEHLHCEKKSTIFFATHYHELAELETELTGVRNFHMEIREKSGEVKFLYQLATGPAGKSYGIQVGKIAGLPSSVTQRASEILSSHENRSALGNHQMSLFDRVEVLPDAMPVQGDDAGLTAEIRELDPNNLTPISALMKISEWHQKLRSEKPN